MNVKDYSISQELFELYKDESLDILITKPKPEEKDLYRYYESKNYISHTDSNKSLFERLYHFVKIINLNKKLNLINKIKSEKGIILDIGMGTGDFLLLAKNDNWNTIGIEPNNKARKKAIEKKINIIDSTYELENNSIDIITMWHVLEHIYDLEEHIVELKRIIKPLGTIIIAVPNYKSYDANYYGQFWAGYDVPRHLWHFSKISIQLLFEKQNLKLNKIIPMKWDSYYVSLLSEKYKTGSMNYLKAIYRGWISNRLAKKNMEYSSLIYIIN